MVVQVEKKPAQRKRRGRGEGSIYQRADGRWVANVSQGVDGDGKRKRRVVYGDTKKEVQDELGRLQSSAATGQLASVSKMTVAEALDTYLDTREGTGDVRASTLANYRRVVKLHIRPNGIGGKRLQKLTPADVQGLFTEMARAKVGASPRRLAHIVLSLALKQYVKRGIVPRNVCDVVDVPQVAKNKIMPLNEKQVGSLLAAADGDRLEALYHVALGAGMREGELFGLHWASVDLVAGTIQVSQSLSELGGKLYLGPPKSKAGRRLINLPQHAVDALERHRRLQMTSGLAGAEFVFTNLHGGPLRRSHFHADDYKPLLKRAGLPDTTRFHDLRHTHATLCLLAGENPLSVSLRLGHSKVAITLDTYSHVLPSVKTDAASRFDSIIQTALAENGYTLATKTG
jgi:integrase